LSLESRLWTKFSFTEVSIEYIPSIGTNTPGTLLLSHVEDPEISIGPDGTIQIANALSSVPGAVMGPVWTTLKHSWRPRATDNREFYIQPDETNKERLTVQGLLKIMQMTSSADPPDTVGLVYMKYKVILYEPILALDQIADAEEIRVYQNPGEAAQAGDLIIENPGRLGFVTVHWASGTTGRGSDGTVYSIYFNFPYSYVEPFAIYFIRIEATITQDMQLYNTAAAAYYRDGTSAAGSFTTNTIPVNGRAFISLEAYVPPTETVKEEKNVDYQLTVLRSQIKSLTDQLERITLAPSEREVDEDPPVELVNNQRTGKIIDEEPPRNPKSSNTSAPKALLRARP